MGQLSSRPKASDVVYVPEPQPCVLKYTTITAENHSHLFDETPVCDAEIVEGRKRSFFSRRKTGKYDLAQAEKVYQNEAGSYRRITDDQTSNLQEAPASETLPTPEEQLEQDILQHQDVNTPVSSTMGDFTEEINDLQEASACEVLPTPEEQLEQDILQHQDVNTPVSSTMGDFTEEINDLQEASACEVLPTPDEQLEQDVLQQDVDTPDSSLDADNAEELDEDQISLQTSVEIDDLQEAPASEVLPTPEEQLEQDVFQPQDADSPEDDDAEEMGMGHICWRYEIGHKLGEGGFGFVNAGTRCKDGLKVAVKYAEKMPHMPYITVPGHPKRLPMEIGLTFMANKGPRVPEIIKLLDWQDNPDHYIMVMERPLPCMDLDSFVKLHGGSLKEETARHVMRQTIHAANVCCERGVFHRDVRLKNLLINQDTMEVKLIDFGCGALMKDTAYLAFHGKKVNCPPEFNTDSEYFAKPTTVWSLGILLFEMVCGDHPSAHDMNMISANNWSRPGLSQECCQIICASLQPNPQQRLVLEEMRLHDWFKVME